GRRRLHCDKRPLHRPSRTGAALAALDCRGRKLAECLSPPAVAARSQQSRYTRSASFAKRLNEDTGEMPMRAAIFRGGEIVADTLPEPKPAAGQVLVKTLACGICGSDLHARKHAGRLVEMTRHFPGRKPMDLSRDVVFGHEF